jgi:hypothetical protein
MKQKELAQRVKREKEEKKKMAEIYGEISNEDKYSFYEDKFYN